MKFKVGDKVIIKNHCSGTCKGEIYTLYYARRELWAGDKGREGGRCHCHDNWEPCLLSQTEILRRKGLL